MGKVMSGKLDAFAPVRLTMSNCATSCGDVVADVSNRNGGEGGKALSAWAEIDNPATANIAARSRVSTLAQILRGSLIGKRDSLFPVRGELE